MDEAWTLWFDPGDLKPGDRLTFVGRFPSEDAAVAHLDTLPDQKPVREGRYTIDPPLED